MRFTVLGLVAIASYLHLSIAKLNCPLYGPLLPRPTNLLQHPGIQAAASALDDVFPRYIDNDNSTGSDRFSYSVEVFAGSEDEPLWSHYWTAPNLVSFNSTGVSKVDTNTVYRIGSVTKIFTILTFLATVGDGIWNDPITKHLPEIEEIARDASGGPIYAPDWDSITIGSLASQTSGLIRDYAMLGELSYQLNMTVLHALGFPPLPSSEFPPCGTRPTCDREQLFEGLAKLPPSFPPFTTPTYSDIGFVLLSYVAERITGKDFNTLVTDVVLKPLNLNRTFVTTPDDSVGIIPGTQRTTSWGFELDEEAATGNMYTSAGDLSSLGRAILRSTLLKPAMTRRWLKPVSYSSDPKSTVGMPWGVRQIELGQNQSYQFIHTFNKAGSLGAYSALLAIMPELDIGFTVLVAGVPPPSLTMAIADALTSTYIPTLMYVARDQANATFGGHYRHASLLNTTTTPVSNSSSGSTTTPPPYGNTTTISTNTTAPQLLNSSLTITVDPTGTRPGLGVENWLSNSTHMAFVAVAINMNASADYLSQMEPSVRLYPTGLEEPLADGGRKVAFKAVFEDLSMPNRSTSFVTDCSTWVGVTGVVYGSKPLDLFVFELGEDGRVKAVENGALRVRLEKVG
ncbi:Beta-lactamase-like protein 2 [Madurella mycetomatis]|uniref:Beta-lactamase-like protein 2 n=1 Tax=Madurella mycetomatis TaxID=100816 RepID=A0A175W1A8_9PEZI|nr:Beta-lactamase-like protein 2 [Madurella mycetomatis]KXX81025.1 Beta-lactamase-like protein 2 [Madurella mycetomatis]